MKVKHYIGNGIPNNGIMSTVMNNRSVSVVTKMGPLDEAERTMEVQYAIRSAGTPFCKKTAVKYALETAPIKIWLPESVHGYRLINAYVLMAVISDIENRTDIIDSTKKEITSDLLECIVEDVGFLLSVGIFTSIYAATAMRDELTEVRSKPTFSYLYDHAFGGFLSVIKKPGDTERPKRWKEEVRQAMRVE